jgi:hypothetical protein
MLGCCSFYFNLIISNGIYQFKIMSIFMQPEILHVHLYQFLDQLDCTYFYYATAVVVMRMLLNSIQS